jgi:predicted metal-binding membrane protein
MLEALIKRDRSVVAIALTIVIAATWVYILLGAGMGMSAFEMSAAPWNAEALRGGMSMAGPAWSLGYAVLMFYMWWIMMIAMMLPSAAPMILLHARIDRQQQPERGVLTATGVFAAGYLLAWAVFSLLAVAAQWGLEQSGLLSMMLASTSAALGGGLLLAAGLWQLTPLKHACLRHCRSPVQFLSRHWRGGAAGALRMGALHGAFCLGCCWFLMALLFYGGVMNLYWIVGLALFVLVEKLLPAGHRFGAVTGLLLIAWGGALLSQAV